MTTDRDDCCHRRQVPRHRTGPARSGPGEGHRTSRHGPVPGGGPAGQDRTVLATAGPSRPRRSRALVRLGRHRPEDRVRAGLPAARDLARPAPGHQHHPAGRRRGLAYALRAWLASEHTVSTRTRRFAKWSAIFSFALGMAGQIAYHLLAQAGAARAPWPITTIVSCLPVLVLAMGTTLAHMLHADATQSSSASQTGGPATPPSPGDRPGPCEDQAAGGKAVTGSGPPAGTSNPQDQDHGAPTRTTRPDPRAAQRIDHARLIGRRLTAAGKPVSRRALRSNGVKGSNEALNALARTISAELAGAAAPR
jgi:hypothetical protein